MGRLGQLAALFLVFTQVRTENRQALSWNCSSCAPAGTPTIPACSTDHGTAAADLGFANLGVTRFQHFGLGKLRFSFAE